MGSCIARETRHGIWSPTPTQFHPQPPFRSETTLIVLLTMAEVPTEGLLRKWAAVLSAQQSDTTLVGALCSAMACIIHRHGVAEQLRPLNAHVVLFQTLSRYRDLLRIVESVCTCLSCLATDQAANDASWRDPARRLLWQYLRYRDNLVEHRLVLNIRNIVRKALPTWLPRMNDFQLSEENELVWVRDLDGVELVVVVVAGHSEREGPLFWQTPLNVGG